MKKSGFILLLAVCFLFSLQFAVALPESGAEVFTENKIIVMEEVSWGSGLLAEKSNDASMRTMQAGPAESYNKGTIADASFEADNCLKDDLFEWIHYYNYYPFKNKTTYTDFKSGGEAVFFGGTDKLFSSN